MRFGCLGGPSDMGPAAETGFDYIEAAAGSLLLHGPEEPFRRLREEVLAEPLFPEVVQLNDRTYISSDGRVRPVAFRRAALLGARVAVVQTRELLGAPGDHAEADWHRATELLAGLGHDAARASLLAAVLADGTARGLEESWMLVQEAGHPALGVAVDADTLCSSGCDPADVLALDRSLLHLYVPVPAERRLRTEQWERLLDALHEMQYHQRVTVNCAWQLLEAQARAALGSVRERVGVGG